MYRKVVDSGQPVRNAEFDLVVVRGLHAAFKVSKTPMFDENGGLTGILTNYKDVSAEQSGTATNSNGSWANFSSSKAWPASRTVPEAPMWLSKNHWRSWPSFWTGQSAAW